MSPGECRFEAFGAPGSRPAERRRLVEELLCGNARVLVRAFLRRHRALLDLRAPGVAPMLDQATEPQPRHCPLLPLGLATLREDDQDPVWLGAATAAHLGMTGLEGRWSVELPDPRPIRLGAWVTPPARRLWVRHEHGQTWAAVDGGPERAVGAADAPGGWMPLTMVRTGRGTIPVLGASLQPALPMLEQQPFAQTPAQEIAKAAESGFSILNDYAPAYASWVHDLVAALVPIQAPPDAHVSYSSPGMHGVVWLSFPADPLAVAEMLVHEVSHSYLHLGQLDTLFVNGMDQDLHYSPYGRKGRPLAMILMAFHAFANVALFYQEALAAGLPFGRSDALAAVARHRGHLSGLCEVLDRSPGLTADGRALVEPLRAALFA